MRLLTIEKNSPNDAEFSRLGRPIDTKYNAKSLRITMSNSMIRPIIKSMLALFTTHLFLKRQTIHLILISKKYRVINDRVPFRGHTVINKVKDSVWGLEPGSLVLVPV